MTAFQVLEHLPNPDKSLRLWGKALKTGVILLVEVPRFDTWSMWLLGSVIATTCRNTSISIPAARCACTWKTKDLKCWIDATRRTMSMHNFFTWWITRRVPKRMYHMGEKVLKGLNLWRRKIRVAIGDILTVIGRKK